MLSDLTLHRLQYLY